MKYKDIVTIILSVIAIIISLITLWITHLSPFHLQIYPPAITQTKNNHVAVIVDITCFNSGAKASVLTDLKVNANSEDGKNLFEMNAIYEIGTNSDTKSKNEYQLTVFQPIIIKPGEAVTISLYCTPFESKIDNITYNKIEAVAFLNIDFKLNNKWHFKNFRLEYPDFKEKFVDQGNIIIEDDFQPRWYRNERAIVLIGQ